MPRILVAEDEVRIARLIQVNLKRAGYETTVVADGIEAVVKIVADRPALVILDMTLPRMDGYEVLQYIRADEDTRRIPVVALLSKGTANFTEPNGSGMTVRLVKPFNPMELIAAVKRILPKRTDGSGFPGWMDAF